MPLARPQRSLRATVLHALDFGAERAEALVDALVAALDLSDVVDDALAFGTQRREEHGHAGPNVRRFDAAAVQLARADDDGTMGVAEYDARAHPDQLVHEEQAGLEHLLVDDDHSLALGGGDERDRH